MTGLELRIWLIEAGFPPDAALTGYTATLTGGMTALMHAARRGDVAVLRALLKRNVDVAVCDTDGRDALWFACYADCEECIADLIAAGAIPAS